MRTNFPETAILTLTNHDHDAYLASTIDVGAAGLFNLDVSAIGLKRAIRLAAQNEILFDQEQLGRAEQWQKSAGEKWAHLSKRQKQVLQLRGQGISKVDVATQLEISPIMVDYHIGKFLKRLKVKSLADAVNWMHKYFPENLGTMTW